MTRVATPYTRNEDDMPECVVKFVRGSNNHTRATIKVFEYPNGDMCLQLEDKLGGAELWGSRKDLRAFAKLLLEFVGQDEVDGEG
jgi:hypothetical protein